MKEAAKKQKEDGISLQGQVDDAEKESDFFMKERNAAQEQLRIANEKIEALEKQNSLGPSSTSDPDDASASSLSHDVEDVPVEEIALHAPWLSETSETCWYCKEPTLLWESVLHERENQNSS